MQPFLGISPAKSLGAPSASDAPTSNARGASDPANGQSFRTALNSANQRSDGSGRAERSSGRPTSSTSTDSSAASSEDDAISADGESTDDPKASADAMAMLLSWLVPVTPTSTPAAPAVTGQAGTGLTTETIGAAADGALVASFGVLSAMPNGPADASDAQADLSTASTGTPGAFAALADPALADAISETGAGIPLTGMTAVTDEALTPDLLAAMRAAAEARAAADGSATTGNAATAQATVAGTSTDLTDLAATFGAQIVSSTGANATRPGTAGPSATGEAALPDDAQLLAAGSTAQAAGAGAAAGVQLPGQAVAAAGTTSQGTSGTLAEAMEAGPEGVSATQPGAETRTDFQATLGAAGTTGVAPSQDVETVQTSATTATPVASQIADGAVLAARRTGQSVEMILQPEGLGSVTLRVTAERAGLAVHIAVDNPQSRELVQASWPQLQQALEQRGLTVQSLLLDLSNGHSNQGGQGFQAFQQFSGQQFNGQQARGGSGNPGSRGGPAIAAADEGTRVQSSAASASRVDYRI